MSDEAMLTKFSSEELIVEIYRRKTSAQLIKDADSDDMLAELDRRGDMPECQKAHLDSADEDELLEALGYDPDEPEGAETLLQHGIEDRDWKKIEEAASLMQIRWSFVLRRQAEERKKAA
jgi:hypothetical protein